MVGDSCGGDFGGGGGGGTPIIYFKYFSKGKGKNELITRLNTKGRKKCGYIFPGEAELNRLQYRLLDLDKTNKRNVLKMAYISRLFMWYLLEASPKCLSKQCSAAGCNLTISRYGCEI